MEQMQDSDYKSILKSLENKIPQDKVRKIILDIKSASDLQDHGDSPYTRPTFSKIFLLGIFIVSVIIWLVVPLYGLYFSAEGLEKKKAQILHERQAPSNISFAFDLVIETTLDDKQTISVYRKGGNELLAKSDIENNQAYVLSSKIGNTTIKTAELQMLKTTKADLNEEIKDDILFILNKNISVNDSYLEFKHLDFGVDTVINTK